mgnify:FL=1
MVRKKQRKDKEMAERQEQAGGSGESETRVVNKATSSWSMFLMFDVNNRGAFAHTTQQCDA